MTRSRQEYIHEIPELATALSTDDREGENKVGGGKCVGSNPKAREMIGIWCKSLSLKLEPDTHKGV